MATKARAYAQQARADYEAYVASGEMDEPVLGEHHRLQLLQMALEKLSKAFLYYAEPDARYTHHVVLSAINRLRSHRVAEAAGLKLVALARSLDAAKPIFLQIEAASPSVGNDGRALTREESERAANVEYPWQARESDAMSWTAPVSHAFPIVHSLRYDSRSAIAVRLLGKLIDASDVLLPSEP